MRFSIFTNKKRQSPLGYIYLIPTYKFDGQVPSLNFGPGKGFNNQYMDGFLARKTQALIQPTFDGPYDFSWLTDIVDFCDANGKVCGMQNLSGGSAPLWMFGPPWPSATGPCYSLSYGLDVTGNGGWTTVCWDPEWQSRWHDYNVAAAALFGSRVDYVNMSGVGFLSESFLIGSTDPQYMANAAAAAGAFGYPATNDGAVAAWIDGTKWNVDMMMSVWPESAMVNLTTGAPFPPGTTNPDSHVALQEIYDYGQLNYPGRWGCRPNNLSDTSPPDESDPSIAYLHTTYKTCIATGFQYRNSQVHGGDGTPLDQAIQRGNMFGAHFQEFFPQDPDDTRPEIQAIFAANRSSVPGIPV